MAKDLALILAAWPAMFYILTEKILPEGNQLLVFIWLGVATFLLSLTIDTMYTYNGERRERKMRKKYPRDWEEYQQHLEVNDPELRRSVTFRETMRRRGRK